MMWQYAHGLALTWRGNTEAVKIEVTQVIRYVEDPATESLLATYNNPGSRLFRIVIKPPADEISLTEGKISRGHEIPDRHSVNRTMQLYLETWLHGAGSGKRPGCLG